MTDLIAFLTARIDEDEQVARAAFDESGEWRTKRIEERMEWWVAGEFGALAGTGYVGNSDSMPIATHIARHDPARVLREVAAKRAVVDGWPDPFGNWTADQAEAARTVKEWALLRLARAYANHPDFDPAWAMS